MRAVAVLAVVGFHLWPDQVPGGFLGVTVFFALSGYLIVTLLLSEIERSGGIALSSFIQRRVRRLLPAALATVAVISVVWAVAGWLTETAGKELLAATLQVSNWQRIVDGQAYGVDATNSPVLHFWSLAIEEQIYLVLPVVVLVARTRQRLAAFLIMGFAASISYTLYFSGQATVVYFSTFSRAAEVLAGALVAVVMYGRTASGGLTRRRHSGGRTTEIIGGALVLSGAVVMLIAVSFVSLGDMWLYRGGLTAMGVIAALTIAGLRWSPVLARALDREPLTWIGQRSYGIYLFHWPFLVGFTLAGVTAWMVPWLTILATLFVTVISYARWEQPIRAGALSGRALSAVLICVALVVPVSVVAARDESDSGIDFEAIRQELDERRGASGGGEVNEPSQPPRSLRTDPQPLRQRLRPPQQEDREVAPLAPESTVAPEATTVEWPVRVGFFGDSKALVLGFGLGYDGEILTGGFSITELGCPLGRSDWRRDDRHQPQFKIGPQCDWSLLMQLASPDDRALDIAVVWFGTWDIREKKVAELGDRWMTIDEGEYRAWLFEEMKTFADEVEAMTGVRRILWLTLHPAATYWYPSRYQHYNDLVGELAAVRDIVDVADIAGWLAGTGEAERLLPDGIHPTPGVDGQPNTAAEIGERWLNQLILEAAGY